MFGIHDIALFLISSLLLNITPGPDSLLVINRSATQGWRAGLAAAFGIGSGIFVHIFAAALGLSAALAASATAFMLVKYAGAAYLVYIGIGLLRSKSSKTSSASDASTASGTAGMPETLDTPDTLATPAAPARPPYRKIYLQGFLTNALNPKVAMFFLAFMPQFISPDAPHKALAFVLLGCLFNISGTLWSVFLAVTAAQAGRRIRVGRLVALCFNRMVGLLFVAVGIRLAFSGRH